MPPSAESIDSAVQPLSVPNRSAVKLLALRETGQQVKGCLPRFKVPVLCLHGVNDCFVLGGMLSNLQSDGSLTNVILIGCNTRSLLYIGAGLAVKRFTDMYGGLLADCGVAAGGTPALWQGLTHLTITHSPLSSIAGISQAPQLQHLDLRANQLTALEITMQLKSTTLTPWPCLTPSNLGSCGAGWPLSSKS